MSSVISEVMKPFSNTAGQRLRPSPTSTRQTLAESNQDWYQEVRGLLEDDQDHVDVPTRESIRKLVDLTAFDDEGNGYRMVQEPAQVTTPPTTASQERGNASYPWKEIKNLKDGGQLLRRGAAVELIRHAGNMTDRPHFLFISTILCHAQSGEVKICGHPLRRSIGSRYLPQKLNEVYLDIQQNLQSQRSLYNQGTIQVALEHVFRERHIVFTHRTWPAFSCVEKHPRKYTSANPAYKANREKAKNEEDLVCRFIVIRRFLSPGLQKANKMEETEIRRLYENETPLTPPSEWRLGSRPATNTSTNKFQKLKRPVKQHVHTYGSGFGGWGGDTEGARRAGLRATVAFDEWKAACHAYQLNHPRASVYNIPVFDILRLDHGAIEPVDHLHLSPPCPFWSPAHTKEGKNDDKNIAALFCVEDILKKLSPRTHSQEQTSGILTHHGVVFGYLVHMIVSAGYNIRWKIANFGEYGLPSSRKRLVIFAARVGEALPKFPQPTHGNEPGLQPFTSIHDGISRIPKNADFHLATATYFSSPADPYNAKEKRAPCMTTGGMQGRDKKAVLYPDGSRTFTLREYAALNGFDHMWKMPDGVSATDIKTMIGNSVPPLVWVHFARMIKQSLADFDSGRINEAGLPVRPRRNSLTMISGNSARTPQYTASFSTQARWSVSRTLSPDPKPSSQVKYDGMDPKTTVFSSLNGENKLKRKGFVALDDLDANEQDLASMTKRVRKLTVDLTGDDD